MPQAIVLRAYGSPDELRMETVEVGAPCLGEVRLRQLAIGVNFHDVYVRSGLYRTLSLPGTPGIEAVAEVTAVGPGVSSLRPGDRIAYCSDRYGAYASDRLLDASLAFRLPDDLSDTAVAGIFLKGLTVDMLMRQVHAVRAGNWLLVHAAAGGVGRLLCQWASHLGAKVIGTVGSDAKAELAKQAGCDHVILYRTESVAERVRDITSGQGVDVAYDSVGRDTFDGSLDSLALRGHLVQFGQASGPVEPLVINRLAVRSITLTRPILFHYAHNSAALADMSSRLFAALRDGWLTPAQPQVLPLGEAARAHALLQSGQVTTGLVLVP
jgi:NADPH2:quinone reductase